MNEALVGILFALWFIAVYVLTVRGGRELKHTRAYWLCTTPPAKALESVHQTNENSQKIFR